MRVLIGVVLCFLAVWGQEEPTLNAGIEVPEPEENAEMDEVQRASSVIADSIDFVCEKGYQCVPALVPVPCPYGTYKEEEGFMNCIPCEPGCTTLRKGAGSMYECVPFCPHGYERSRDTCTPCRPGYYKSSWGDEECIMCPEDSTPDPDSIGMINETECYWGESDSGDGTDSTEGTGSGSGSGSGETEEPQCPEAACSPREAIQPLVESQCTKYCECLRHEVFFGQYEYIWLPQSCPTGMLFDGITRVCLDRDVVTCNETGDNMSTPSTSMSTSPSNPSTPSTSMSSSPTNPSTRSTSMSSSPSNPPTSSTSMSSSPSNSPTPTTPAWSSPISQSSSSSSSGSFPTTNELTTVFDTTEPTTPATDDMTSTNAPDLPDLECPSLLFELVGASGSGCRKFYECANGHWVRKDCPPGTRFNATYGSCLWEDLFVCPDSDVTGGEENSTSDGETVTRCPDTSCSYYTLELIRSVGSLCESFCQCTARNNSMIYQWVELPCAPGTLFSEELGLCNHEAIVDCNENPA